MTPLETRLAMKAAGFSPIPCKGKHPLLSGWQTKFDVSQEDMARWPGTNTGMLCAYAPVFDLDVLHPEAAAEAEALIKDWFDGRGIVPVRIGLAPKRALLFRTNAPFPKMSVYFHSPNGDAHKIEVLCNGQQVVVDGIHPDTHKPYVWHGGRPGGDVTRDDLPELDEAEARELLALVTSMLIERFGFECTQQVSGNGQGHAQAEAAWGDPVDVDARLAAVTPGAKDGGGVHDTGLSCTASLLRDGYSVDAATLTVLEEWRKSPDTAGWDWESEERKLRGQSFDFITKHPDLSYLLPDELRGKFESVVRAGKSPRVVYNRVWGWHVRGLV
jgi:hypothetical protein